MVPASGKGARFTVRGRLSTGSNSLRGPRGTPTMLVYQVQVVQQVRSTTCRTHEQRSNREGGDMRVRRAALVGSIAAATVSMLLSGTSLDFPSG